MLVTLLSSIKRNLETQHATAQHDRPRHSIAQRCAKHINFCKVKSSADEASTPRTSIPAVLVVYDKQGAPRCCPGQISTGKVVGIRHALTDLQCSLCVLHLVGRVQHVSQAGGNLSNDLRASSTLLNSAAAAAAAAAQAE
jgi:hypothetical protein